MAGQARKRTAAQRKEKVEDIPAEDKVIQDEQEQENDIQALRTKNAANNQNAQRIMDVGIIIALLVHSLAIPKYVQLGLTLPIMIVTIQLLLLPLSLSPHWVSPKLRPTLVKYHDKIVLAQFVLVIIALQLLVFGRGRKWKPLDIVVWALPLIVSGSVELQRRSERNMEVQLKAWEKTKYNAKGA